MKMCSGWVHVAHSWLPSFPLSLGEWVKVFTSTAGYRALSSSEAHKSGHGLPCPRPEFLVFLQISGYVPWFLGDVSKWADCPLHLFTMTSGMTLHNELFTPRILPMCFDLSVSETLLQYPYLSHSCLSHSLDNCPVFSILPQPPFLNSVRILPSRFQPFVFPRANDLLCPVLYMLMFSLDSLSNLKFTVCCVLSCKT